MTEQDPDTRTCDVSALVPADPRLTDNVKGARAFSTTALNPIDHGDFNLSITTALRHGEDVHRVRANLRLLRHLCARPVARLRQVHSARVIDLDRFCLTDASLASLVTTEADALVTSRRGVALAILTGDCTPLLFVDPVHAVFAAAHSGRLGTQRNIAGAVIGAMKSHGANPADIRVWIGPRICGDCYETGEKIANAFEKQFAGCSTRTRFGGKGISMGKAIRLELTSGGILQDHIYDAIVSQRTPRLCCTLEDRRFYSYRGFTKSGDIRRDGRFYTVLCV